MKIYRKEFSICDYNYRLAYTSFVKIYTGGAKQRTKIFERIVGVDVSEKVNPR
jgi:hypothetical protein